MYITIKIIIAIVLGPIALYVITWVASRAYHDAKFSAVRAYSRALSKIRS